MSYIVGLKEDEYTELEKELKKTHDDYISKIESVVSEIQKLNAKNGGLYLAELTPQITSMVSEINTLKDNITIAFETHEKTIKNFQFVIEQEDIAL